MFNSGEVALADEDADQKVLGLRAEPRAIHWALVSGSVAVPILEDHDKAEAPASFDEAAAIDDT
jgi:hypothetical protein